MENFLGEIRLFPYTRIPSGWLKCEGQVLAINQFQALFSLIGTEFGGNGQTSFMLPDLRGRAILGAGQDGGYLYQNGTQGGAEAVTLSVAEMGAHTHNVEAVSGPADQYIGAGYVLAAVGVPLYSGSTGAGTTEISPTTIETAGGGQPHDNVQPSTVSTYCIASSGLYPGWE